MKNQNNEKTGFNANIMFNGWKHHRDFIMGQIAKNIIEEEGRRLLLEGISIIGNSVTDLYFGSLSPDEISDEIIVYLQSNDVVSFDKFLSWVKEGGDYRLIVLSDTSYWAVRLGNENDKYIHIHPGRYSPKTVRIKALTLKTIIVSLFWIAKNHKAPSLEVINQARKELLLEPPLKHVNDREGIGKLLKFFAKKTYENNAGLLDHTNI